LTWRTIRYRKFSHGCCRDPERDVLHTLMDNVPDLIYFKDAGSCFTRINRAEANLLAVSQPEEAIGKTDSDYLTQEHARKAFAEEQEILRTGEPLIGIVEQAPRPDGRSIWVHSTKMPIRDVNGAVIGTFGVGRDITDRKRAAEEIKTLNWGLEQRNEELAQANNDLEAFTYSVAHDLRAPLRQIQAFSRVLVEDFGPQLVNAVQEHLQEITQGTRDMGQLIDDLLGLAHLGRQELSIQVTRLNSVVEEVRKDLKTAICRLWSVTPA
jgi:PAS domain S-box-containing protein